MEVTPEAKALVEALHCYAQLEDGWEIAQGHLDAYATKRISELVDSTIDRAFSAQPATADSSKTEHASSDADFAGALY